jgi:diguanylate cyclase (GGDEF)-like protein
VAVLIAPALLVTEVLANKVQHGLAIAIGSATMFLLVVARMAQLLRQAERTSRQVRELSRRDELTGLPNRRAWVDELPRVLEEARRDGLPVSIGMLDLDHFKSYNDRYGHPAGDRLLKEAAAAWHGVLRRTDILARYGGEEFIVLLPGADIEQAAATLERLRKATPPLTTFSAGVAAWDRTETSEDLIARADAALYSAKDAGRNRVIAVLGV